MSASQLLNADSSDDETMTKPRTGLDADSSDDDGVATVKKIERKTSLDSIKNQGNLDSSDDEGISVKESPKAVAKKKALASDSDDSDVGVPDDMDPSVKIKKPLAAASSDDGEDSEDEAKVAKKKVKAIVDSDDDSDVGVPDDCDPEPNQDANSSVDEDAQEKKLKSSGKKKKMSRIVDSDSDNDDASSQPKPAKSNMFANKDLYDAESSEDELPDIPHSAKKDGGSSDEEEEGGVSGSPPPPRSPKQSRKSAQQAMDEIRSESSRLMRESSIGLPYHRPKQRSLAEFLDRKKGQPQILDSIKGKFDSSAEQKLQEREKALKEFYRPESEEEEEVEKEEKTDEDEKKTDEEEKMGKDDSAQVEAKTNSSEILETIEDSGILSAPGSSDESKRITVDEYKPITEAEGSNTVKNMEQEEADAAPLDNEETLKLVLEDSQVDMVEDKAAVEEVENEEALEKEDEEVLDKEDEEVLEKKDTEVLEKGEEEMDDTVVEGEDSLKLVLEPDTPVLEEEEVILSSQVISHTTTITTKTKAQLRQLRLERLRAKFGDVSSLEQSMDITPRVAEGRDDDLVFTEREEETKLSVGAEKLFQKFVTHAHAGGVHRKMAKDVKKSGLGLNVENVTIVTKKKQADGSEVLCEEVIEYKTNSEQKKKAPLAGAKYLSVKMKLKKQMMDKRLADRSKRAMEMKMDENEMCDDLPDDEEEFEGEEELYDDEEEYVGDEEEDDDEEDGESEPEEDDVEIKENKKRSNVFADDEAEDDEMDGEASDDDSIAIDELPKKSQFKKILDNPELMSESSSTSDIFKVDAVRVDMETPTAGTAAGVSAPSSNSSMGTVQPRWTPFQDRLTAGTVDLSLAGGNDSSLHVPEYSVLASPTNSQLAKKRLGFEGLFDQTDPEVTDIDDVVGLCSGKFTTQKSSGDAGQEDAVEDVIRQTQQDFMDDSRPPSRNIETQDTVILTGPSGREGLMNSAINSILEDVANIPDDEEEESEEEVEKEDMEGGEKPDLESDKEEETGEGDVKDDGVKVSKKRKRRLISDSEGSDDEEDVKKKDDEEESNNGLGVRPLEDIEYDSDENPIEAKPAQNRMFDGKGKLKKDFFEAEAELSGSEEGSDDEDERGLDKFEMEAGDLDDIDEDMERDKLGRIHQKLALDEDQANMKLFQDRFLEDGDLHTDYKRQRQFKWAGLDDAIEVGPSGGAQGEGEEEEAETLERWRLEKMEREKWLKEQEGKEGEEQEEEDSQFFQLADRTLQRMSSKEGQSPAQEKVFKSPLAKVQGGPLQPLAVGSLRNGPMRGSFLARDAAGMDRLERFSKGKEEKVGVGAKGRNFVFATLSPPKNKEPEEVEEKPKKSSSSKGPPAKKQKMNRNLDENSRKGTIFNLL